MARPHRMREIAEAYDEPLDKVVLHLLNEHGSIPAVAQLLGTTIPTLSAWCRAHKIEKQITWTQHNTVDEAADEAPETA